MLYYKIGIILNAKLLRRNDTKKILTQRLTNFAYFALRIVYYFLHITYDFA